MATKHQLSRFQHANLQLFVLFLLLFLFSDWHRTTQFKTASAKTFTDQEQSRKQVAGLWSLSVNHADANPHLQVYFRKIW